MTSNSQLTSTDIAQMAGVGLSTVSNWRRRHEDFPEATTQPGTPAKFNEVEVREWLKKNNKRIKELPADSALWKFMNELRNELQLDEAAKLINALLVWRAVSDLESPNFLSGAEASSHWSRLAENLDESKISSHLTRSMTDLARDCSETYRNVFEEIKTSVQKVVVDGKLHVVRRLVSGISEFPADTLSDIYVSFQQRLSTSMRRGYDEHSSSSALIDLFVELTKDIPGTVHDPAVGSGRLLFAVAEKGKRRSLISGQDINNDALRQAAQRALILGIDNVQLHLGDVFMSSEPDNCSADVVVLDPPFGMRYHEPKAMSLDERLIYGTPTKTNFDMAWLQVALWRTTPTGRAFVLQPSGTASRTGNSAAIRHAMLKEGAIEAIVSLPASIHGFSSIPVDLWVLVHPQNNSKPDKVFLADFSNHRAVDVKVLADALNRWRVQGEVPTLDNAGIFDVSELLTKVATLTPQRWLTLADDSVTLESVNNDLENLERSATDLASVEATNTLNFNLAQKPPKSISITELVKDGALEVHRVGAKNRVGRFEHDPQGTPVATGPWIRGKEDDPQRINPSDLPEEPLTTEPNDILLQTVGDLAARVDHSGSRVVLSPSYLILRLKDEQLLPGYLAEMVVNAANQRQEIGATVKRIRLEDLNVVVMPRADQQRVLQQLAKIRKLQKHARQAQVAAEKARDAIVNGLSSGVIQLD